MLKSQASSEDEGPYSRMPGRSNMRQVVVSSLKERKRRILREMAGERSD